MTTQQSYPGEQPQLRAVQFGYSHASVLNPWHAFQPGEVDTICGRSVFGAAVGVEDVIDWADVGTAERCKTCARVKVWAPPAAVQPVEASSKPEEKP